MIHFNRVFHYKPSILGYPYFWKYPYKSSSPEKKNISPTVPAGTFEAMIFLFRLGLCSLEGKHHFPLMQPWHWSIDPSIPQRTTLWPKGRELDAVDAGSPDLWAPCGLLVSAMLPLLRWKSNRFHAVGSMGMIYSPIHEWLMFLSFMVKIPVRGPKISRIIDRLGDFGGSYWYILEAGDIWLYEKLTR